MPSETQSAPAEGAPAAPSEPELTEPRPEAEAEPSVAPAGPELSIPTPGELGDRLVGDLPPPPEQKSGWTAPTPIVTLHGYFRARGELMDKFWLGRPILTAEETRQGAGPDPFTAFRPLERQYNTAECGGNGTETDDSVAGCKINALKFANVRFRFSPQLNLSEDIRIKSTFDILDNYVLGEGPQSYYGAGSVATALFPGTTNPTGNIIVPRRIWAEVRNRDLGELRFGLMPDHWGLGLVANAGNGLDDDYSTDLGRVLVTTKLAGFYLSAAYDFLNEGQIGNNPGSIAPPANNGPAHDASQIEDLEQFTFSVVRRVPDEDEDAVLARGSAVLDGGVRFQLRNQSAVNERPDPSQMQPVVIGPNSPSVPPSFKSLNGTLYIPDIWGQLRYGKLRLGVEAAWILGDLRNIALQNRPKQYVSQLGVALESELRLLSDKLGLYLYAGGATGDSDVDGLSSDADYINQAGGAANNSRISTFRFHPAYRVDLILWRNIMRQVTGAMYVKPGISYDLVKDSFGQLFGARVDLIYSRASSPVQTWGNDANLGVEIDAQIYWRSADGPNVNDGFHAILQYGVLFPMKGLGYVGRNVEVSTAQTLRLVLGVMF